MADNVTLNPGAAGDSIRAIDRSGVETQVVVLDAGGASGESLVTPTNPLPISLNASTFVFSTLNTSTAQLAAGATFTGTIEAIPNQPAISVLMTSDQPVTILLQQFIDAGGIYAVPNITTVPTPIAANVGTSFSVPANGNYFRIVVKNVGSNTTTTFNVNVAYGNIDASTPLGNSQVAINEIGGTAIFGTLPVSGTVNVGNLPTFDPLNTATPQTTRIVGRPDGDFADIDLLEQLMNDGSGLSANVRVVNPPKQDINGAQMVSDAPDTIVLRFTTAATTQIIDTRGYNSMSITCAGATASLSCSDNLSASLWSALSGTAAGIATLVSPSVGGTNTYTFPCMGRYVKFTGTGGAGLVYVNLRSAPWAGNYLSSLPVTANVTQISTVAVASVNSGAGSAAMPVQAVPAVTNNADLSSAARTTSGTGNSAFLTAGWMSAVLSVTAASGTTPTLDLAIQESSDNGVTWVDTYHCERVTGISTVPIPKIPFPSKMRYSWTIGGTTPSFTFAVTNVTGGATSFPPFYQFFDRTAGLLAGTASATSSTYTVAGCKTITASITIGAATTGGMYKLQGSSDGANWYDISANVTAVANSTVQVTNTAGVIARFVRVFVATGATAQTGTVVSITGTN